MDDHMVQSVSNDRVDKSSQHEYRLTEHDNDLHQEPAGIPAAQEQRDQL